MTARRPSKMTVPAPPPPAREIPVKVSDVISYYAPTKRFKPTKPETAVTSFDFDDGGELLVAALNDDTLQIYNCKDGTLAKSLHSKKYGAHLARFTHQSQSVIYASTKVDDTIRYLSTHDNQYIRYFQGHTGSVTDLSLCPRSDNFMSCSLDNTARLWALNTPNSTGKLLIHTPYLACFDPSATVVAIACPGTSSILMYDVRNYDKAPFATFDMETLESIYNPKAIRNRRSTDPASHRSTERNANNPGSWTTLEFSNDGKNLLLGTASGAGHYVLDAFSGDLTAFCASKKTSSTQSGSKHRPRMPPGIFPLTSHKHDSSPFTNIPGQGAVCLTPDGRYVIGSSGDQTLSVWDIEQAPRQPAPPLVAPSSATAASVAAAAVEDPNANPTNNNISAENINPKSNLTPVYELDIKTHAAVLAFNHRFHFFASADREVVFLVPDKSGSGGGGGGAPSGNGSSGSGVSGSAATSAGGSGWGGSGQWN